MKVYVVIPAYNEEQSITQVINSIPKNVVSKIIVVNNNSMDDTVIRAEAAGAIVVHEPHQGYGQACLRGVQECKKSNIIVFLDADLSDDPTLLPLLIKPIQDNQFDLVIGSRLLGEKEPGSLPLHAQFGNRLSCFLIKHLFGVRFTDLGPFRAIRTTSLHELNMQDRDFGWTVEMQAKAALLKLRCTEIPVSYKKRIGQSKISGTITGSFKAGIKILWTIFTLYFNQKKIKQNSRHWQ